jgi:hypothetical protein
LQGAGWEKTTIGPDRPTPLTQKQKDDFFAALDAAKVQQERVRIALTLATQTAPPTLTVTNVKGVVLRGIRFRGPPTKSDGNRIGSESLITFDTASGTIRECAVVAPFMNGVTILTGSEVKIEKSLVAAVWGTGVSAHPGTKLHISDSDIRNCYHRCVTLGTDDATIERCRISGSAWHGMAWHPLRQLFAEHPVQSHLRQRAKRDLCLRTDGGHRTRKRVLAERDERDVVLVQKRGQCRG